MTDQNTALATRDDDYHGLVMVVPPSEAELRLKQLQEFVRKSMVKDLDYGVIPGTDKPTLYQPGAQKLAEIYGFAITFEDARPPMERWDDPAFFAYFKRAVITSRRDGRLLGSGVGSCNSRESKYAGRWVYEREVPTHLDRSTLKMREFRSKRGEGTYRKYFVPNEDICSLVNTIEKMACKRSLVHAVIAVTRSSGLFTQDVEDLRDNAAAAGGPIEGEMIEGEIIETPVAPSSRAQAVTAKELGAMVDAATTPEPCLEALAHGAGRPKLRYAAYKRLVVLSKEIAALVALVERVKADAEIPAAGLAKLLDLADQRRMAIEEAAPLAQPATDDYADPDDVARGVGADQ